MAESNKQGRRGRDLVIASVCILFGAGLGLLVGQTDVGEQVRRSATRTVGGAIARSASMDLRMQVILENPAIVQSL